MDKAEHYLSDGNIIGFPKLGIEFKIDSTAVSIFGFDIKWYGVIIAFGMLLFLLDLQKGLYDIVVFYSLSIPAFHKLYSDNFLLQPVQVANPFSLHLSRDHQ